MLTIQPVDHMGMLTSLKLSKGENNYVYFIS